MPAYILTGTPGSGKTAILRQLELDGHTVVEEAATDVIALQHALGRHEPWREPEFIDQIVALQHLRFAATPADGTTFFDRSPVCTLALCRHLGLPPSQLLRDEVARAGHRYERTVLFVRNQGFLEPTAARRISFEDSLAFERIHEHTYRELGFTLVDVPAGPLPERVVVVGQLLDRQGRGLGVEDGPPFGRFDDAVQRDEGRFDQFPHCRPLSRVVEVSGW
jgi:predicted ATPase